MSDTATRIDRPVPNRPLTGYLARARRRDAKAIAEFKKSCNERAEVGPMKGGRDE